MLPRSPLENHMQLQIRSLGGFEFQDFVVAVLYQKYGSEGFSNLRPVRDGGCDGLIFAEKCAIACYGPANPTVPDLRKKLSADYKLYSAKWQDAYPNWRFFVNFDLGPDHIAIAASLHGDGDVLWGLSRLHQLIKELGLGKRIVLCRILNIPANIFASDVIKDLLDDLMQKRVGSVSINYRSEAPDLEEKVRINFSEHEVDLMLKMISVSLDAQAEVDEVIRPMGGTDVNALKIRVMTDFSNMPGNNFSDKFKSLQMCYAERYNIGHDDVLQGYIVALLIHMFSLCLIGSDPAREA